MERSVGLVEDKKGMLQIVVDFDKDLFSKEDLLGYI